MTRREIALAILNDPAAKLTEKSASFLGQATIRTEPFSERQEEWFQKLAQRAGLTLTDGGDHE